MSAADPLPDPSDDKGPAIVAVATVSAVIATILVGLRFYTRAFIIRGVGCEDWLILISLVWAIGSCASIGLQVAHGLGRHSVYVEDDKGNFLMFGFMAGNFYNLGLSFTKLSILTLYLRVFTYETVRRLTKILLVIVAITQLFMVLVTFTGNIPIDSFWDSSKPVAYKQPKELFFLSVGFHLSTDVLIFLLPITVIKTLRISRLQKIILGVLFTLGFSFIAADAWRFYRIIYSHGWEDPDITYVGTTTAVLTCVELGGVIVCACLTTLKPLAARLFPRLFRQHTSYCNGGCGGGSPSPLPFYNPPPTIGSGRPLRDKISSPLKSASSPTESTETTWPTVAVVVIPPSEEEEEEEVEKGAGLGHGDEHLQDDWDGWDVIALGDDGDHLDTHRRELESRYPGTVLSLDEYHRLHEELASPERARLRGGGEEDHVIQVGFRGVWRPSMYGSRS